MSDARSTVADAGGLDRRTMIKRAAAAGAVAWTAPVIIDSLASPAAAFTAPTGCHFATFNSNCSPNNQGTPCNNITGCTSLPALAGCLSITCNADGSVDVTNQCGAQCSITGAQGKTGSTCVPPDSCNPAAPCCSGANGLCPGNTTQSVHWNPLSSPGYSQFSVFLTCT
jgi:hypothetical protein